MDDTRQIEQLIEGGYNPIEVGISSRGLDAIVRNLRGLSRRQAERIIIDTVADDKRFDDNDINKVISALHEAYAEKKGLNTERILKALRTSPPLSATLAESVQSLRAWAGGRCVPAD